MQAPSNAPLPALIGVIHLRPLPESPRYAGDLAAVVASAADDARHLARAGFEGVIVENFGDAPFVPGRVSPVTVAAMTAAALSVRVAAPGLALGINVLRNDAEAALAVAVAAGAAFIRVNVHTGARVTDQGLIEGRAHETLRLRRALGAEGIRILADIDVKHSAPLAARPLGEEAHDLTERGFAEGVIVTGSGTGRGIALTDLHAVADALGPEASIFVGSGATIAALPSIRRAYGVIAGSCLRASGRAGDTIDETAAHAFAEAWKRRER